MLHTGVGPPLKYNNMKIKVVDFETQPQGEEQLATIDEAEEDYNNSKTLSSSSKEEDAVAVRTNIKSCPVRVPLGGLPWGPGDEVMPPAPEQTAEEEQQQPTKQRVQQLHKCEKCGKMLTLKSLRYSHSKYCGKVSEPVETKMKPEPKVRSKPVSVPEPVNDVLGGAQTERVKDPFVPEPVKEKTFDEMRKERHEQRRAAHKESIQKLFAKAI